MPPALSISIERMSITEGTLFIAEGFNGSLYTGVKYIGVKWIINRTECQF